MFVFYQNFQDIENWGYIEKLHHDNYNITTQFQTARELSMICISFIELNPIQRVHTVMHTIQNRPKSLCRINPFFLLCVCYQNIFSVRTEESVDFVCQHLHDRFGYVCIKT